MKSLGFAQINEFKLIIGQLETHFEGQFASLFMSTSRTNFLTAHWPAQQAANWPVITVLGKGKAPCPDFPNHFIHSIKSPKGNFDRLDGSQNYDKSTQMLPKSRSSKRLVGGPLIDPWFFLRTMQKQKQNYPSGGQTRFRPMQQGETRSVSNKSSLRRNRLFYWRVQRSLFWMILSHTAMYNELQAGFLGASYAMHNTPSWFICTGSVANQR